jgi:hypothetical protein
MPPAGSMLLLPICGVAIVPHFFLLVPIDSSLTTHIAGGSEPFYKKVSGLPKIFY